MKTPLYFLVTLCVTLYHAELLSQTITPTQTDALILDNGQPDEADPGDRIRYTVTITESGGTIPANNVTLQLTPDVLTTFVSGSFRSSPLAIADVYTCTGNVGIQVPVGSGLLVNDFDDNTAGLTATAVVTAATTMGGQISITANGSFTYIPPAGFTGADSYTYTLNDGNPVGGPVPTMDMGVVTFNVTNLIYFIDNSSVAATSDGRRNTPYKTLTDFNSGSTNAADVIYVEHTGTNYTGGILLANNERLFGEGHTGAANLSGVLNFTLAMHSLGLPAINGMRPVITNSGGDGVTLAMNNNLRGFDVGACMDFAIENNGTNSVGDLMISETSISNTTGGGFDASHGSGFGMNVVLSSLSSSGGTNGINLVNCAGSFSVNGGTISNPSGTGAVVSGGSVVVSCFAAITDNSGLAVDIDNHDSGNVTFSGNITSTGTGIRVQNCGAGTKLFSGTSKSLNTGTNTAVNLSNNTNATINFTNGGLIIITTSGIGFSGTGGGTVTVQGTGNTISSTSATALNVVSTTIGASGMTFQSISSGNNTAATDPVNGIVLNVTGTSGGLIVTGNNNTTRGGNGSGGIIQNTTGDAIKLTSCANTSITNMIIQNIGTGSTDEAGGIDATNITGTNRFKAGTMTGLGKNGGAGGTNRNAIECIQSATSMTLFDVDNCLFYDCDGTSSLVNFTGRFALTMSVTVQNSEFYDLVPLAVQISSGGEETGIQTVTSNITNNIFRNASPADGQGCVAVVSADQDATHNFTISNNTFYDLIKGIAGGNSEILLAQTTGGALNGTISGNTLGNATAGNGDRRGIGVIVEPDVSSNGELGSVDIIIENNTVDRLPSREAIFVDIREDATNCELIVRNNNIGNLSGFEGQVGGANGGAGPDREAVDIQNRGEVTRTLNLLFQNNNIRANTSLNAVNIEVNIDNSTPGNLTTHFTATGNTLRNSGTGDEILVRPRDVAVTTLCLDLTGNVLDGGFGRINFGDGGPTGIINVEQASLAVLAAANGIPTGNVVINSGSPTYGVACAIPPN